jgi:hypothetical protein
VPARRSEIAAAKAHLPKTHASCLNPEQEQADEAVVLPLFLLPAPAGGGERLVSSSEFPRNRQRREAWRFFFAMADVTKVRHDDTDR